MSEIFNKNLRQISKFEFTPKGWRGICVRDVCDLGRGRVISHEEITSNPGPYPVYSSQTSNDGLMGSLDSYEFNSELITWTTDGANAGTVFFRQGKFNCTNVCGTLVSRSADDLDLRFLTYQIGRIAKQYVSYHGNPKLMNDVMGRVALIIPSQKAEQQRIAEILSTIDQTIEKTEALIHKYQQIKAGLMHDLFTRGLTAAGKLRPPREQAPELYQETPIGWIPKEWEVVPLGQMSDITSGVTLSSKTSLDQKLEVPYLRVANVQDGYLDLSEIKTIKVNQKTFENLLLKKGDVLMNEGGDFDKLGRGTVWQDEIDNCIHQNHVFRVRVNQEQLRPYYLAYWSESDFGKKYFVLSSKQSTNLASINSTQLKAYHIAKPEQEEQERIESRVNSANLIIQNLKNENLKLTFQKSGLMHDLLTGKVPVTIDQEETAHG